ncbi:secretion system protein [Sphingomonas lenta]|uniref:Secretion system protein n=2 Tax=Sphingomonas lenta TaxID=1141887 RepID=A0A2A2SKU7_9SPHN|nr:secretion system protein [Sphingomonas lenta]
MAGKYGRSLAAIIAAALAGGMPGGAAPAAAQSPAAQKAAVQRALARKTVGSTVVHVATGKGRLITLNRPVTDVFISNPGVADVHVRTPTELYLFGTAVGDTTISATGKNGEIVFSATVRVGNNIDSLASMLKLAMPESKITATSLNGLVLLTGTVAAPEDAAEAERLVQAIVGDQTKVLSRLKTATPLQVNLQVRIAEVSRTFIKNIGVNFEAQDATSGFLFGAVSGRDPGTITRGPTGTSYLYQQGSQRTTLGLAGRLLGLDILSAIDLGETLGQATTLARPNLTALSGETASFLAGGEIPIPLAQGLGAVSVEFKPYGIGLTYTPTVLSDGRISLRVRPEVSQITFEGAVQINGTSIPALSTRRAETTLELGSGQSMMIAGLLSNVHSNSIERTPALGNLPIIGALFRSNAFRRNETELVIVITPYLVKPVSNPADIALPTDGYRTATDVEQVLLGRMSGQPGPSRPVPTVAPPVATPAIGAAAPVPPAPAPVQPNRDAEDRRAPKAARKVRAGAAPGFFN